MRAVILFLAFFFFASAFAEASGNKTKEGERWQERVVRECSEYALQTIHSDASIAKILATNDSLKEYTPFIVGMTCIAETTRNLEKMNRKMEGMVREAEKRARDEKNAARAAKTM